MPTPPREVITPAKEADKLEVITPAKEADKLMDRIKSGDDTGFQAELASLTPNQQILALRALKAKEQEREVAAAKDGILNGKTGTLHEVKIDFTGNKPHVSTIDVPLAGAGNNDIEHSTQVLKTKHEIPLTGKPATSNYVEAAPVISQAEIERRQREAQQKELERIAQLEKAAGDNVALLRSGDPTSLKQFNDSYGALSSAQQAEMGKAMEKALAEHPLSPRVVLAHELNGAITEASLEVPNDKGKGTHLETVFETPAKLAEDARAGLNKLKSGNQVQIDEFWKQYLTLAPGLRKQEADLMAADNVNDRTLNSSDPRKLDITVGPDGIQEIKGYKPNGNYGDLKPSSAVAKTLDAFHLGSFEHLFHH